MRRFTVQINSVKGVGESRQHVLHVSPSGENGFIPRYAMDDDESLAGALAELGFTEKAQLEVRDTLTRGEAFVAQGVELNDLVAYGFGCPIPGFSG